MHGLGDGCLGDNSASTLAAAEKTGTYDALENADIADWQGASPLIFSNVAPSHVLLWEMAPALFSALIGNMDMWHL